MSAAPRPSGGASFERLKERAKELGWRCLADRWAGYQIPYPFECESGHRFERRPTQMLYRRLECTECQGNALRERWLANVKEKGGELVAGAFTGLLGRYRLRCAAGHEWEAQGRKISEGSWCPTCAHQASARRNRRSDGLALLQAAAHARGGKCHADSYVDGRQRYLFECERGHRWQTQGSEILRGRWCARCAQKAKGAVVAASHFYQDGLKKLQDASRVHGGQCLADVYVGAVEKYRFRCADGHEWSAIASQIWLGHWCPRCAKIKQRSTIEQMQAIAAERGGMCLSTEYEGRHVKLSWQCHLGHVWQTRPAIVKGVSWCPSCANLARIEKRNRWKRLRYDAVGKLTEP